MLLVLFFFLLVLIYILVCIPGIKETFVFIYVACLFIVPGLSLMRAIFGKSYKENPERIDVHFLEQFEEFREFRMRTPNESGDDEAVAYTTTTPEETVEKVVDDMNRNLEVDLLDALLRTTPSFFERVVVELLVKMGYGGSRKEAAQIVGKSGDEGIDGIINEDKLGLDVIYVQAKKWENVVSRPEIQKFVGALQGKRARKGVFITTSRFSAEAREYTSMIDSKVILIDGRRLASLMIEHDLGVSTERMYYIKRIDGDYFAEE